MFKQIKSAIFWTLLYKFRRRVSFIVVLFSIVLLSQWIYGDLIEYLKLTNKLEYLSFILPLKWIIICFNIGLCIYLILSIFKSNDRKKPEQKDIKTKINEEKFSQKEKDLMTKEIRNHAKILLDKEKR